MPTAQVVAYKTICVFKKNLVAISDAIRTKYKVQKMRITSRALGFMAQFSLHHLNRRKYRYRHWLKNTDLPILFIKMYTFSS